jgi:hypothetical protein
VRVLRMDWVNGLPRMAHYDHIVAVQVDRHGNLRLFRKGRVFARRDIFHPAGEWYDVDLRHDGLCVVAFMRAREM